MRYLKMNGAGNDFVILDGRKQPVKLSADQVRAISDRTTGVGCDQLIVLERSERADAFMRIWNADGGTVQLSGNGLRCVAWLLMEETGRKDATIETVTGVLTAERAGEHMIAMDMGPPRLDWSQIPVARKTDTVAMDYAIKAPDGALFEKPGGVNMGNPHAVFFVKDAEAAPASIVGPKIEHDPYFPERVNAGFAQMIAPDRMRLRVWERGAGLTKACGSGACAAVVAANRAGLAARKVHVTVDGGELTIEWREDDHVILTGPVEVERVGEMAA
jgi:diaminopimelate epimerase